MKKEKELSLVDRLYNITQLENSKGFISKDDIPDHVKKYGKSKSYALKGESKLRAWF